MVNVIAPENGISSHTFCIESSNNTYGTKNKKNVILPESLNSTSINHIYNKFIGQKQEAKTLKNLLTNLHNKLATIDSTLEISLESIQTKIK